MIREVRPAAPVARIALPVTDSRFDLPDIVLARQPVTADEAAAAAIAYADEHAPTRAQHGAVARVAYRTLLAFDAAALIGATPAPPRTYGLGIADLHALMAGQPTALDRALAAR